MISTCCSKHVEAWNKYIKKECVKLVINQNDVKMHGQQNIKWLTNLCRNTIKYNENPSSGFRVATDGGKCGQALRTWQKRFWNFALLISQACSYLLEKLERNKPLAANYAGASTVVSSEKKRPVYNVAEIVRAELNKKCTDTCSHTCSVYEGCTESIQPFWISREPVAWPWCNLATTQRSPCCATANSHSPVGLVSRQWDVVDWACVLCDRRIHKPPLFQRLF
jgi:hypothetical protein